MSISCACMPSLSKMLGYHLPAYNMLKSRLHSRFNLFKSKVVNTRMNKALWSGRSSNYNKDELSYSQNMYPNTEAYNPELLPPAFPSVPNESRPMRNGVRTSIGGLKDNFDENDGIRFTVKLQQHSEQYIGP